MAKRDAFFKTSLLPETPNLQINSSGMHCNLAENNYLKGAIPLPAAIQISGCDEQTGKWNAGLDLV